MIQSQEKELMNMTLDEFAKRSDWIHLIGSNTLQERVGVFSFTMEGHHVNDIADLLATKNICVRAGHHCTEPLHEYLGITGSLRMSLSIYSREEEIRSFFEVLDTLKNK